MTKLRMLCGISSSLHQDQDHELIFCTRISSEKIVLLCFFVYSDEIFVMYSATKCYCYCYPTLQTFYTGLHSYVCEMQRNSFGWLFYTNAVNSLVHFNFVQVNYEAFRLHEEIYLMFKNLDVCLYLSVGGQAKLHFT